jgi:hypothetical protein
VEKLQYIVWLPEGTPRADVAPLMVGEVGRRLLDTGVHGLTLDLDDDGATIPPPVPPPADEQSPHAVVSVWVDCSDRRGPLEEVLESVAVRLHGYSVVESLYTDYGGSPWAGPRDWPDGQRSPGILTVATFEQLPGTDFDEWLAFWYEHQSPMSEAMQPRCRYVRNLVVRALRPGQPAWRGIVEEAWPSPEHVTDPRLFFCAGDDAELLERNITTMLDHVSRLMDLTTMRSMTMSEWTLKTLGS